MLSATKQIQLQQRCAEYSAKCEPKEQIVQTGMHKQSSPSIEMTVEIKTSEFEKARPQLLGVAYRLLGSYG